MNKSLMDLCETINYLEDVFYGLENALKNCPKESKFYKPLKKAIGEIYKLHDNIYKDIQEV